MKKAKYRALMHKVWSHMVGRCHDSEHHDYRWYGARGIEVHESWRDDFAAFFDYVETKLGPRPDGHQIDRVDNSKGYEPGNLRWATSRQNNNNRRDNLRIPIDGVTKTAAQWSRVYGVPRQQIANRIARGVSPREAVTRPVVKQKLVEWKGEEMSLSEVARVEGMPPTTLRNRMRRGMSLQEAVEFTAEPTLQERIVEALRSEMTPKQVVQAVGEPYPTVAATLSRLAKSGDVRKVRRGVYAPKA